MSDKKVMIRRKNVYLEVAPEAVDAYVAKGYDILDANGNVIKASVPNDANALKIAYDKHIAEIKELKDKIKELEAQLATKEQAPAKVETPVETKPKTTKSKSKK